MPIPRVLRVVVGLLAVACAWLFGASSLSVHAAIPPTASTPLSGTPWAIPGRIEAADFDIGGPGVAYLDTSSGNAGGAYRPEDDVDLEWSSLGGVDVGWIAPGEWLRYSVDVQRSGTYRVQFTVACPVQGGTFHLEMNSVDVTGPLTVPNTGGWQSWQTVSAIVSLQQGTQSATLVVDAYGANAFGNFGPIEFLPSDGVGPYYGTPAAIPGVIEAVNFDNGPSGTSYGDTTPGNAGGAYRPSSDVDIEGSLGGGYNVGWTDTGEWLNYTVNVTASGTYVMQLRIAAPQSGPSLHVGFNGAEPPLDAAVPAGHRRLAGLDHGRSAGHAGRWRPAAHGVFRHRRHQPRSDVDLD